MLAGSNPAARTRQFQSPRFPYRGAGRLFFRTRFAGSMAFRQCQIMTSGSSLPIPPRLSNRDIRLLHYQSPRRPYRFPAPPHRRTLFDSPCHVSIQPDGTRCRRIPHYVVPFPIGGKTRSRPAPRFPLPYPSNRLLASLLASLSAELLGVSVLSCRWTGRMRVFRAHIRFHRRFRRNM